MLFRLMVGDIEVASSVVDLQATSVGTVALAGAQLLEGTMISDIPDNGARQVAVLCVCSDLIFGSCSGIAEALSLI